MKSYHLFWNKKDQKAIVIRSGFNIWSFLFPFLYPALKGYWRVAFMYFTGMFCISLLSMLFLPQSDITNFILSFAFSVFAGLDYADYAFLEESHNRKTDYLGIEFASNASHAEHIAFQKKTQ